MWMGWMDKLLSRSKISLYWQYTLTNAVVQNMQKGTGININW
jgi:hypothetical protein